MNRPVCSCAQIHVQFGEADLPFRAAVEHHLHRDRTVLLSDVRITIPPAAAPAQ